MPKKNAETVVPRPLQDLGFGESLFKDAVRTINETLGEDWVKRNPLVVLELVRSCCGRSSHGKDRHAGERDE